MYTTRFYQLVQPVGKIQEGPGFSLTLNSIDVARGFAQSSSIPAPAQPNEARQPVSHFIPHGRRAIDREDILSGDQELSFLRYRELLPRLRTMLEKIAKDLQYCLVPPPPIPNVAL